jgi:hexokinase
MFLALDLGGTNFRVILLELSNGALVREQVKHYHIGEELRLGCGEQLFDFLAECVSDFVRSQNLNGTVLPLGKVYFRHIL